MSKDAKGLSVYIASSKFFTFDVGSPYFDLLTFYFSVLMRGYLHGKSNSLLRKPICPAISASSKGFPAFLGSKMILLLVVASGCSQ
jgi:hypothetical protein